MPGVRLKPNRDVLARRLGGELVLLHLKTNRFFELNRTGARFWELLGDGRELSAIEDALVAEFDVTPTALSAEVARLVVDLRAEKLLDDE